MRTTLLALSLLPLSAGLEAQLKPRKSGSRPVVKRADPDLHKEIERMKRELKGLPGGARPVGGKDCKSDSSSSSSSHRVVVVNGKTVVDERTENGKPVAGGPSKAGPCDPEEMRRRLEEMMKAARKGFPVPLPPLGGCPPGDTKTSRSSHTRRVEVVNGKTVVDEATRNGKPVPKK